MLSSNWVAANSNKFSEVVAISVHLRQRKQTSKGRVSLYLEYYKGTVKSSEGRVRSLRDYEYLNLYLFDKPKNSLEKDQNKQTLNLAKSIKAKRELEIKNGAYGFSPDFKSDTPLLEYFRAEMDKRSKSDGNAGNWRSALKHLTAYVLRGYHPGISFKQIDDKFCQGFKDYLNNEAKSVNGMALSSSSQNSYYAKLKACLKQAVKERVINHNPSEAITLPRAITPKREWLMLQELGQLAQTECRYTVLKDAFLFSCLTGLRWSDCQKMSWGEVTQLNGGWRVVFHQQKTKGLQYHDISDEARELLGKAGQPDERVFIGLKYSAYMNTALHQWMLRAGITKDITFHCARHTYAMNQLESGTDIMTLRDMMGHSELKTTLIYAKATDAKRREAAGRVSIKAHIDQNPGASVDALIERGELIGQAFGLQQNSDGRYLLNGESVSAEELAIRLQGVIG